jgi:predicted transcriptional regulator
MGFINSSMCVSSKQILFVKNLMINMYAELEDEISKRVKQLLIKQSNLTVKQVIKKINKDVGKIFYVNKAKIEHIIKSMINNKEIFITTKQSDDSFLNIVDRKSIYYYVDNNPGKTIEDLCKLLDLTKSQMIWHLTFLKKIHYVYSTKKNRQTVYYSNNHHLQGAN